jgi:hypothetical protein
MIKLTIPALPPRRTPPPPPPLLKLTKNELNLAKAAATTKANRARTLFNVQRWTSWDQLRAQGGIVVGPMHTTEPLTAATLDAALADYIALAAPAAQTAVTTDRGVISTSAVRVDLTKHNVAIEQFTLRPQQRKSVDQIIDVLWERPIGNAALNPLKTGAGKSIIGGTLIKYLQDRKWNGREFFMPQPKVLFLTKKAVVTKITRTLRRMGIRNVGQSMFGNDVCVTHYGALRTKVNDRYFEEFTDIIGGTEVKLKRYRGEHPALIILDECQEIKKWDSDRTQRVWAFHHNKNGDKIKWVFTSATPGITLNDMMAFAVFAGIKADDINLLDRHTFPTWVRQFGDPRRANGAAMERFRDHMGALVVSPPNDPSKVKAINRCTLLDFKTDAERASYRKAEQEYVEAIKRVGKGISDRGLAMVQFMIYRAKCELLSVPYVVELALERWREGKAPVLAFSFQESVRDAMLALIEAGIPRSKISLIWGGDKAITETEIFRADEAGPWVLTKIKLDDVMQAVRDGVITALADLEAQTLEALKTSAAQLKLPVPTLNPTLDVSDGWNIEAAVDWVEEHLLNLPIIKERYRGVSLKKLRTRYRKWTKYTYERVKRDENEEAARARREKLHNLRLVAMSETERQSEIDRFQDGTTEFCIYTLSAGGTGVDLDHQLAGVRPRHVYSTVCYYAEEFVQALGRAMRVATLSDVVQEIIFFNNTIAAKHVAPKLMKKVKAIAKIASSGDDLVSVLEASVLSDAEAGELEREVVDETASEVDDTEWDGDDD